MRGKMQNESQLDDTQQRGIDQALTNCITLYGPSVLSNTEPTRRSGKFWCPAFFDTITCWPPTLENTMQILPCPDYIVGFKSSENATKKCMENGTWFKNENQIYWTNYTNCYIGDETEIPVNLGMSNLTLHYLENYVPIIKVMSRTGYTISFFALLLAFFIMFSIKKLHCARNNLHMHLFVSFIMRAAITLVKDLTFVEGVGFISNIKYYDGNPYFYEDKQSGNWTCKLLTSLFNFFITANYSWILMEGLYLYNLIFRSMFADSNKKITPYIILGWGIPFLVISTWITARILYEDTLCWTTHDDQKMTFLIIRIPTAISILLNMLLFVRIAVVIYSKLQAPNQEDARRYRKWARSTLVLAPLFGIHYALLIGMSSSINTNETVELIWLFSDQLFASSQGFVVAVLYCFLNSEVRAELKPHVHACLVYIASHNCLKYLFPCRHSYLSSARGRTSVCTTTMSCSSLFNNGVVHRGSRTGSRGEFGLRTKADKSGKDHVCNQNSKYWSDDNMQKRHYNRVKAFASNGSLQNEKSRSAEAMKMRPHSDGFETICMLPRKSTDSFA